MKNYESGASCVVSGVSMLAPSGPQGLIGFHLAPPKLHFGPLGRLGVGLGRLGVCLGGLGGSFRLPLPPLGLHFGSLWLPLGSILAPFWSP